jgi:hypothetical protein
MWHHFAVLLDSSQPLLTAIIERAEMSWPWPAHCSPSPCLVVNEAVKVGIIKWHVPTAVAQVDPSSLFE